MHPKVHAGILSTNSESDAKDLAEQSIDKVDFVVCNLYPCKQILGSNLPYLSDNGVVMGNPTLEPYRMNQFLAQGYSDSEVL